jgi:hypothetical protein
MTSRRLFIFTFADNLCCQIRADDNSSTCTFTMGKSVTCTGGCANEIIPNRIITRSFTKRKKDVMLEYTVYHILRRTVHGPYKLSSARIWQHKLSANVNINNRLPIKVYYRIYTLRHIRIEIIHGSQNVF